MAALSALWLPIILSSVVIFIVSSLIHMLTPWHKSDYPRIPNEDKVMDALRPLNIPAGDYMFPMPSSMKEMKSPEFTEKRRKGPSMVVTVFPTDQVISMGKSLVLWFLYTIVVGIFAAYVTVHAVPIGAEYLQVFRFIGTVAFIGYSLALWQMWIWYNRSWVTTLKSTIDGLIYALLTAGVFGWLWPR
jgi:hypothetical protein